MKEEEIIEGNKLIAEFMEWEIVATAGDNTKIYEAAENHPYVAGDWTDVSLCFHSSWDWLMPVVEKIETQHTRVIIKREGTSVLCYVTGGASVAKHSFDYSVKDSSKIEATFKAAVDYIKWYNSNR